MIKWCTTFAVVVAILALAGGCELQRNKQIEQENADLRVSLDKNKELLNQSRSTSKKQDETIRACQEQIIAFQNQNADLKMLNVELRKQLEFSRAEADNYKTQIKTLNDQLQQARELIRNLQNQIQGVTTKPANPPTATATGPATN